MSGLRKAAPRKLTNLPDALKKAGRDGIVRRRSWARFTWAWTDHEGDLVIGEIDGETRLTSQMLMLTYADATATDWMVGP